MKRILLLLIMLMPGLLIFAQTAADYFPDTPGYIWRYNAVPLDSLNNGVDSLAFVEVDSFATTSPYLGKEADIVLSKAGIGSTINLLPYLDSSYYHMEGTDGWVYFKITGLDSLISGIDSVFAITFLELLQSFQDWYPLYRFAQAPNSTYQIFNYDTVITYNGTNLSMRFRAEGKRLPDQNLSTEIGDFNCKKFILSNKVFYLLLGVIPITIFDQGDTTWIAPGNWIVKRFTPSATVDLSFAGMPAFTIPGLKYDIALPPPPTGTGEEINSPAAFELYQNYPNPFNPSTTIRYSIWEMNLTTIKIYDVLGNEIAVLVNREQHPGNYEVVFNADNLAAGIYYCRLISGKYSEVRKMVLLK